MLTPLLGFPPEIVMSGRTDAGVHAWGQVLSFDAPEGIYLDRLGRTINSRLGPEVVARGVELAEPDFSARFDAVGRRYRYTIRRADTPSPFAASTSWWMPEPLDLAAMRLACDPLLGERDFSSFCRRPKSKDPEFEASLVRRVDGATWREIDDETLRFEIWGSAFCHQMVRSIVGFHVAVGRGKRSAGELLAVLTARDRQAAESPAPPHGLTLWEVAY